MKQFLGNKFIFGIAALLIGLAMLLWPLDYLRFMLCIIGVILLIGCAVRIVAFVNSEKSAKDILILILVGVVAILGILFVFHPWWIIKVAFVLFGLLIVTAGVFYLVHALRAPNIGSFRYVLLGIAVVVIILGIIVTCNSLKTAAWVTKLSGVSYLFAALQSFMALAADQKAPAEV